MSRTSPLGRLRSRFETSPHVCARLRFPQTLSRGASNTETTSRGRTWCAARSRIVLRPAGYVLPTGRRAARALAFECGMQRAAAHHVCHACKQRADPLKRAPLVGHAAG
jgi:hypothetical protein